MTDRDKQRWRELPVRLVVGGVGGRCGVFRSFRIMDGWLMAAGTNKSGIRKIAVSD